MEMRSVMCGCESGYSLATKEKAAMMAAFQLYNLWS